jgi:hypothetical protein
MGESDSELVHVKVGAEGVDLGVSNALPAVFRAVLPVKWIAKRDAERVVTQKLIEKIANSANFTEPEIRFIEEVLGETAAKYVRLTAIGARAQELYLALPASTATPAEGESKSTSTDWVNKFREDASLVDDEMVREVYARALAEEARKPGSGSLRTLAVLRYLDREVAEAFGRLMQVRLEQNCVPQGKSVGSEVLQNLGLNHTTMLALADAGLVNLTHSQLERSGSFVPFRLDAHAKVVAYVHPGKQEFDVKLRVHVLTSAGAQLAAVAQPQLGPTSFVEMLRWFRQALAGVELYYADLPSPDWEGLTEKLNWQKADV